MCFESWHYHFQKLQRNAHFEKTSFRVKKKIFATYDDLNKRACIKLSEVHQYIFSSVDRSIICPVNNKWGKQGWTNIELSKISKALFIDALTTAYCEVAPKKLAEQITHKQ
jgi:predicted DNA-binding protein (MmcQ/YjbR family)